MTSLTFTSLFLGLVLGAQTVGVNVDGPVTAVEYEVDGVSIGRASTPPWSLRVDLGSELSPHLLVARAMDKGRNEVARALQWLNLPRGAAETEILLEKDDRGRTIAARLSWQSLFGSRPRSISVTLDGKQLSIAESGRVPLPAYESGRTHLLTAELEFAEGARSRADVVLGGDTGEEARSELTAISVTVRDGKDLPNLVQLQGCLERQGRPLRLAAMEDGPAQVILVRDRGSRETREVLGGGPRFFLERESERFFGDIRLAGKDRIRFLWPVPQRFSDPVLSSDLFPSTEDLTMSSGSLHWILTRIYHPEGSLPSQRFADATAVAGLQAFGSSARRAVVVVLGSIEDSSRLTPDVVRAYLRRLRVPLLVWSLVPPAEQRVGGWGSLVDVSSSSRLRDAVRELKKSLKAQHVLWVDGKYLPQEISVAAKWASLVQLTGV
jgi:hypothetical protein